jgi:hypothetical protein
MDQGMGEDGGRRNDTGKISNNGFLVFFSHTIALNSTPPRYTAVVRIK